MKNNLFNLWNRFDKGLMLVLEWFCIALFASITVIMTLNIVVRFVPVMSMHWFDEILELLYGALIFYGSAALWVVHGHFSVGDWISKHIDSIPGRMAYRFLVELMSLVLVVSSSRHCPATGSAVPVAAYAPGPSRTSSVGTT